MSRRKNRQNRRGNKVPDSETSKAKSDPTGDASNREGKNGSIEREQPSNEGNGDRDKNAANEKIVITTGKQQGEVSISATVGQQTIQSRKFVKLEGDVESFFPKGMEGYQCALFPTGGLCFSATLTVAGQFLDWITESLGCNH